MTSLHEPAAAEELEAIGALGALALAASQARCAAWKSTLHCGRVWQSVSCMSRITCMHVCRHASSYRSKQSTHQKWVQCCKCDKWRQVPFNLTDEELTDEWECRHNVLDPLHSSCDVPQVLSDKEIDALLAQPVRVQSACNAHAAPQPSSSAGSPW